MKSAHAAAGKVRIIAGRLRGSKLLVPDRPGLRPTSDRVRETLFNWLAPVIDGARVLDLFAGTGALGIEAWSRGAERVVLVETDATAVSALRGNVLRLGVTADVVARRAEDFLATCHERFHLIFVDPPFADGVWAETARRLESAGVLVEGALIYVESPRTWTPDLPDRWVLHRELLAGSVRAALYRWQPALGRA